MGGYFMEFFVSKRFSFEACHSLENSFEGKCRNLHGHSFKCDVCIGSNDLDENDVVIDFNQLSKIINPLINEFDHSNLNTKFMNPTAETIAKFVFIRVHREIRCINKFLWVESVKVWETEKCHTEIRRKK